MNKIKTAAIFSVMFIFLGLISCSKKNNETSDKTINEAEMEQVNKDDFTETDEDLLTVDYKEFYDELAPHGEWIEVKGRDIGVDLTKGTSSGFNGSHRSITISELFGVKEAYADDVDFGAFFVWKPAPNLAVGLSTTEAEPVEYVPYSNGQWVNTTQGWYFHAASEPEEITHHYGRWVLSPSVGWVWVPGRVWSPAWVDWREQNDYIAWQPVPPSTYIVNNTIITPPVVEERYVVVEKRYFVEPDVYRYVYRQNKHGFVIKEWRRLDGVMVTNNTIINRGPDVTVIQNYYTSPIGMVAINPVVSLSQVSYTTTEYRVFTPEFKKVKHRGKVTKIVTAPGTFVTYDNAKVKTETWRSENKKNETSMDNKGNNNNFNRKYIDDGKMKDGGKNNYSGKNNDNSKNKDNGRSWDKGKGNDKQKGNDNQKGNDKTKGNDKKGKDNGNVKKDNGKGNNDKGNDNKGSDKKGGKEKGNKKFRNDQGNSKGNDSHSTQKDNSGNDKPGKDNGSRNKGKHK